MTTTYQVIGKPAGRVEGPSKVSGVARYTADMTPPGTLWGKALRSPHAHALIKSIDVSKAASLPGVRAVLTGKDMKGILTGRRLKDVPILAEDRVRFVGEKVAAVAADTEEIAEEALGLIEVVYEEIPPVADSRPEGGGSTGRNRLEIREDEFGARGTVR